MRHAKGWTAWNVGLWLMGDEGMYRLVREAVRLAKNRDRAAQMIHETLVEFGGVQRTPDGARYTKTSIRAALVGWKS